MNAYGKVLALLGVTAIATYVVVPWGETEPPGDAAQRPTSRPSSAKGTVGPALAGSPPELRSAAVGEVRLAVFDRRGLPIHGACVMRSRHPEPQPCYPLDDTKVAGISAADGTVTIDASSPHEGSLIVSATGYVTECVPLGPGPLPGSVTLQDALQLSLRCRTMQGEAVTGAEVTASRASVELPPTGALLMGPAGSGAAGRQRTDDRGESCFASVTQGRYCIEARHPHMALVSADPDYVVDVPGNRVELKFAPIWAVAARIPQGAGRLLTSEYRIPESEGGLSSVRCREVEADLARRWNCDLVLAIASATATPADLRGRILTEGGWYRFRAPFRQLQHLHDCVEASVEPEPIVVSWGEIELGIVDHRGSPVTFSRPINLVVGDGVPTLSIPLTLGRRTLVPAGEYRVECFGNPFVTRELRHERIHVVAGQLAAKRLELPQQLKRVRLEVRFQDGRTPAAVAVQVRSCTKTGWMMLPRWSTGAPDYHLPAGDLELIVSALGAKELRTTVQIGAAGAATPEQLALVLP